MSWSPHDLHWGLVFWTRAMPTPFLPLVMAQEFGQSSTQIGMVSWHFGGWNMACEMWWILTQTGGKASRNEGNLHKKCCHIHPNGASIASYCSKWWNMAHASNIKDHKTTPRLTALCLNCLEETILSSIFWVFFHWFLAKNDLCEESSPPKFQSQETVGSSNSSIHRGHVFHPVGCLHGNAHCRESGCMATDLKKCKKISRMLGSREVGNSCVFYSHRIHVCYIYGAPWIPSIYPSHVSIFLPAPWIRHGIVFGSCGRRLPRRITTDPLHSRGSEQSTYRVFSFCLASGWGSSVLDQIFKKCSFKTNMEDVHNCHNMS